MYACIVTRTDVGNVTRCGHTHGSYVSTRARVRVVYDESFLAACTIRLRRYSKDWTTRTSELRYYPYRATFDFECWFDTEQLPSDSDQVHWVARHVPLSVSVASNVPGHERLKCLVTNGDTNKLVIDMMAILISMSDAAYDSIKDSYENVLEQLAEAMTQWDEQEETTRAADDKKSRRTKNPYKKLMGQLYGWMRQLPVVGFNSGKYDLNVVKQFLVPYFLSTAKTEEQEERKQEEEENEGVGSFFVIKRNNTFMCLSTDQLKFLDMINYIAPRVQLRQVSESVRVRGDERSFPVRVHGSTGEAQRHRSTAERGLLQSTEERRYFRRGLRQLSEGLVRQRHDDLARLSRLV